MGATRSSREARGARGVGEAASSDGASGGGPGLRSKHAVSAVGERERERERESSVSLSAVQSAFLGGVLRRSAARRGVKRLQQQSQRPQVGDGDELVVAKQSARWKNI